MPASTDGTTADSDLPKTGEPARRALETIGVTTLAQLATRTEKEVADLHGMGPKGVRILKAALADAGLSFAPKG